MHMKATIGHSPDIDDALVLGLDDIDRTQVAIVGGKGANLGELSRIDGVRVPAGFCVTTNAFRRIIAEATSIGRQLDELSRLNPDDRESIVALSAEVRRVVEAVAIPADVAASITGALDELDELGAGCGAGGAYAVRSSATAEDLPSASFAGQQDTYLNVVGPAAILDHVSRCWASLFTERAVTYRLRNGFEHDTVQIAVVVQRMIVPDASGILFTADPVTSNRRFSTIEAGFGLGEALVSGLVNPDVYRVRDGEAIDKTIAAKQLAIVASPAGGTERQAIDPSRQEQPALTDLQAVRLAQLGRQIEAHYGCPQDIEWCLVGEQFHIVQSRPITTLFPVPVAADDGRHVYVSVGHQQMMTDAMKPLGLSMWQLKAIPRMYEAAGRLFVDVAPMLASSGGRAALQGLAKSDPLTGDALATIIERDFVPLAPDDGTAQPPGRGAAPAAAPIATDPAIVVGLKERTEASIALAARDITSKTGPELIDFILTDIQELKRNLSVPLNMQVIMAGMDAAAWLNDHLHTWLGEKNAADTLAQSAPDNVTSEMGLALLDVADAIRPHPEVVDFLHDVDDESFLDQLPKLAGGRVAHAAIQDYLAKYGMRCVGEIDITRPRWSERPTTLVPLILSNVKNFEPGEGTRRFEQGLAEASKKEQEVLERLRALPDGAQKADETKHMIDRVRTFAGYREHPKYGMVSRSWLYKQALMEEADRLVQAHVIGDREDIFFLTMAELGDVVRTRRADDDLIARRKHEFRSYQALTPPRVLTSDGEVIAGSYHRDDLPAGALVGLAVSAGTIEGRARVILDVADADLEAGDILVTAFTDPSWSPLFVAIEGLVTEVGGLMTHGAVIAREYGLPAVVGVENATRLIKDGQRIRVHGTDGYIEILAAS